MAEMQVTITSNLSMIAWQPCLITYFRRMKWAGLHQGRPSATRESYRKGPHFATKSSLTMAFRSKSSKRPRSPLESFISGLVRQSQTSLDLTNRLQVETWRIEAQIALAFDLSLRRASSRTKRQMRHGWETHWSTRRTFGSALFPISTSSCRLAWPRIRIWG